MVTGKADGVTRSTEDLASELVRSMSDVAIGLVEELLNGLQDNKERRRKWGEPHFDVDRLWSKLRFPISRGTTNEQIT